MSLKHANLWQSPLWEKFQKKLGRKTWFFQNDKSIALVIKYPLPCGFNWLDIGRGPIGEFDLLNEIVSKLQKEEPKTIFIRIMPNQEVKIKNFKINKAHANHQPETTLKLDLTQTEAEILNQMKPKGRYNIRLSERKGVKVFKSNNIEAFYKLTQETTMRDSFFGHSLVFYKTLLESFGKQAELLLAEYQNQIIAAGIFVYTQEEAIYYYGASSNQHRNVMAPYLLQWKAIQESKKRECKQYDFLGIAPVNAPKNHPWKGVTDFKKKFGGEVINYYPAQEIILKPFFYLILILMKKIRKVIKK